MIKSSLDERLKRDCDDCVFRTISVWEYEYCELDKERGKPCKYNFTVNEIEDAIDIINSIDQLIGDKNK